MTKAVIFDFGNVLVHFDPDYILAERFPDEADRKELTPIVFARKYWDRTDDGSMTEDEVYELIAPSLKAEHRLGVKDVLLNWHYRLPEWEGMRELILSLKARGVSVFVISNISKRFADHASEIPILSLADGTVFSACVGVTKPSPEIFALACERFGFPKEECVFIDDSLKNIEGAKAFGMNAILFDGNVRALAEHLKNLGI